MGQNRPKAYQNSIFSMIPFMVFAITHPLGDKVSMWASNSIGTISEKLEVSGPGVYKMPVIVAIAANIICIIGGLILVSQPVNSNLFWVGSTESLLGVSLMITAVAIYYRARIDHQKRMLAESQNMEEYRLLLADDQDLNYEMKITGFIQKLDEDRKSKNVLVEFQTNRDLSRTHFWVDGKPYVGSEAQIRSLLGNKVHYFNPDVMADFGALIGDRYNCYQKRKVQMLVCAVDKKVSEDTTRFNLLIAENAMEVEQVSRILDESDRTTVKYLHGKLRINFSTGDAVFTWSSPQDELPSLEPVRE